MERQSFLEICVDFLHDPRVQCVSLGKILNFLNGKGYSTHEVVSCLSKAQDKATSDRLKAAMWKVFDIASWNKCESGICYILITLALPKLKQFWHYAQMKKVNAHSNMASEEQKRKLCQLSVQHAAWALKIYSIHFNQTLVSVQNISRRRIHKGLRPLRKNVSEEAHRLLGEVSLLRCSLIRNRGRDFAAIPKERPLKRHTDLTQEDTMLKHIDVISGDDNRDNDFVISPKKIEAVESRVSQTPATTQVQTLSNSAFSICDDEGEIHMRYFDHLKNQLYRNL